VKKNNLKKTARVRDYAVLVAPVVTEKSALVGGEGGGVVFKVKPDANKTEIREAVERVFNVEVKSVRTSNLLGKLKRTTGSVGRRASVKKAYVTLKQGHTIDIVEGL
jgi:large subunit ribosomal protein L23